MNNEHGNKLEQRVRFVAKRYREEALTRIRHGRSSLLSMRLAGRSRFAGIGSGRPLSC